MSDLLSVILQDQSNIGKVVKYLQLRGNTSIISKYKYTDERPLEEFKRTFKKLTHAVSKNQHFQPLMERILNKSVIEGTIYILQKAISSGVKEVHNLFKDEAVVVEAMNSHLVADIIKIIASKFPGLIYDKQTFPKIVSILLMLIFVFAKEPILVQDCFICLYKVIAQLLNKNENIDVKEMVQLLNQHQLFRSLFSKLSLPITN